MKKNAMQKRRLVLEKQTVANLRTLDEQQLADVAGGVSSPHTFCTCGLTPCIM